VADEGASGSGWWTAWSIVGIAAWVVATVLVAATNDDPSDATPILRTFALGGGMFFAVTFAAAARSMRRRTTNVDVRLLERLAVTPVEPRAVYRAVRRTRRIGSIYVIFGAVTTGLALTAIGLGEDGPTELLLGIAFALVIVWAAVAVWAMRTLYRGSGALLAPLGLSVTRAPTWLARPSGGGQLLGDVAPRRPPARGAHGRSLSRRVTGSLSRRRDRTSAAAGRGPSTTPR
jgi:hypothetical protein